MPPDRICMGKVSVTLSVTLIDRRIGWADFGVLVLFGKVSAVSRCTNSSIFEFRFYKKVGLARATDRFERQRPTLLFAKKLLAPVFKTFGGHSEPGVGPRAKLTPGIDLPWPIYPLSFKLADSVRFSWKKHDLWSEKVVRTSCVRACVRAHLVQRPPFLAK